MKKLHSKGRIARLLGLACLTGLAPFAMGETVGIDLTTASSGVINGATFNTTLTQPTGSGFIHSFVRIGTNEETVQGFNTDARPLQFDENNSGTFTHSVKIADLLAVDLGGTPHYQFLLDINQEGSDPLFSLNEVQIFRGNAPDLTATITGGEFDGFGANGQLVYDMDAGVDGDVRVELDYNLNHGSGSGDMFLFVPKSLFDAKSGAYLYLFSKFGDPNVNNDGYEEWAVRTGTNVPPPPPPPGEGVPLPAVAWAGFALFGGLGMNRRRRF